MMRIKYTVTAILLLFYFHASSQNVDFVIEEISDHISVGSQSGFEVSIIQAKKKNVGNAWVKMLNKQSGNKSKAEEKKGEISIKNALIERIYHDPVNIYAIVNEEKNGVVLKAFFQVDSVFINNNNNSELSLVAKNMMLEFAKKAYKSAVEDELKEEEKELKSLQNDLKKLVNENEKMEKVIAMNESEIETVEVDLDLNKKEYNPSYGETVPVFDSEGNEVDRAAAPKAIVKIDPEKKKELDKEQKKLSKKKYKLESGIRKSERNIPLNLQMQEEKKAEIEAQKLVVEQVRNKLEVINQ